MQNLKDQSLVEVASRILTKEKKPLDIYVLFNSVCSDKQCTKEQKEELLNQFYSDLITSAKFVYTGDNMWDLKENQKADLWEKDGFYFKEYTKVELEAEEKVVVPKPAPKKPTPKKPKKKKVEINIEEIVKEAESINEQAKDEKVEVFETPEEIFEEETAEFDEEKYNEYMDTYEDKYEK